MDDMVATGGNVHYRRPPVRRTKFTVYFKPLEFDLGLIMGLCKVYGDDYPIAKQVVPRGRPGGIPPADPFAGVTWPMPAVELVNGSLSRKITFQNDQISLRWSFDGDAPNDQYPRFDVLADELIAKFADFVRVVDDFTDGTVEVDGCECYYSNSLEGIGGQNWLAGYLTDWSQTDKLGSTLDEAEHFSFNIHREDEQDGVSRVISIFVDEGAAQSPELDIKVEAALAKPSEADSDDPTAVARTLLNSAHQVENWTFEHSFSDDMKSKWGAQ
jgi:uncharacterized protein (TIGR04255 family)